MTEEPLPLPPPPTPPPAPPDSRLPAPAAEPSTARAAAPAPTAVTNVSAALQVISTYVPTEILTLYIAVLAALRDPVTHEAKQASVTTSFWLFLAATPLTVWLVYAAKLRSANVGRTPSRPAAWPIWEMVAATLSYAAWAVALPDTPFVGVTPAIGGVVMLTTSTLLGLAAPVFQRPLGT